jgi:2-ketocyclohexanecarboxyl-CoA hydrolase
MTESASEDGIRYEPQDDVAWITLDQPGRRNALDSRMCRALTRAVEASVHQRVVVLKAVGPAFCAGGYLGTLAAPNEYAVRELYGQMLVALRAIRECPRPVIAVVDGPAMGGGNELVIACDLALASDRAIFGQTGPRVGSAPVFGGTNLLALSIGEKRAKEVSFLCRKYSAIEAFELGWVNRVVRPEELDREAKSWVAELVSLSPRYLEIAKSSSNAWWNLCSESFSGGHAALAQAIGSADMIEGASAFLERRPPNFPFNA